MKSLKEYLIKEWTEREPFDYDIREFISNYIYNENNFTNYKKTIEELLDDPTYNDIDLSIIDGFCKEYKYNKRNIQKEMNYVHQIISDYAAEILEEI